MTVCLFVPVALPDDASVFRLRRPVSEGWLEAGGKPFLPPTTELTAKIAISKISPNKINTIIRFFTSAARLTTRFNVGFAGENFLPVGDGLI